MVIFHFKFQSVLNLNDDRISTLNTLHLESDLLIHVFCKCVKKFFFSNYKNLLTLGFSMNNEHYKRTYHPLVIILYKHNMLTREQIHSIPKSTRHYWNSLNHNCMYGNEWATDYVTQFDDIKQVFTHKYMFRTMRLLCRMNDRFNSIIEHSGSASKILRTNSTNVINQVESLLGSSKLTLQQACKFQGISTHWYHRQKQKVNCPNSIRKKCFKQHPRQLTEQEVHAIGSLVTSEGNHLFNLTTLYYKALNEKCIICAKSTFAKYAGMFRSFRREKKPVKPKDGFRALRPFEWLHIDITYVPTVESGMQKVAFVKDNFSKAILHFKSTSGKAGGEFIRDLLKETFMKYNLLNTSNPIHILTDGGPENKGFLLDWINDIQAPPQVLKITAKTSEFPFSNSMSESTHSIFKTEFLQKKISNNEKSHIKALKAFIHYYNNLRYPGELFGLTPLEVLNGAIPDKHKFKEQIAQARHERIQTNKALKCTKGACALMK